MEDNILDTKFCYSNVERETINWIQMKNNIPMEYQVLWFLTILNDAYK